MSLWNLRLRPRGIVALILVPAALLTAAAASAAVECRYTDSRDTLGGTKTGGGSILLDPPNVQVRYDPPADGGPRSADVRISNDGGASWTSINLELQTYFQREDGGEPVVSLSRFFVPPGFEKTYRDIEAEVTVGEGPEVAGLPTREVVVEVSFTTAVDYGSEVVKEDVESTWRYLFADVWEVTPFAPLLGPLRTGVEPVDQRLAEALEEHPGVGEGVAVWSERVTRFEIHGETPEVRRARRELVSCEPAEAPPAAFAVPEGFRYQEPVMSGLGGEAMTEPPGG